MYNGFTSKKNETTQSLTTLWKKKFGETAAHSTIKNAYASHSQLRVTQWMGTNLNTKAANILEKGCSSLLHPDHHQFRDYSPNGSIYLRRYIPEKNRIVLSTTKYLQEQYIKEAYNSNAPNIQKLKWLRVRSKEAELAGSQHYKDCDEISRINSTINQCQFLNEPINPRDLTDPVWRNTDKKKFKTKKGFVTRLRTQFGGKFDPQAWQSHKIDSSPCEYKGGYEETGDLNRKRNKSKEVSKKDFNATNPVDIWKNRLNTSCSLRTHIAQKVIKGIIKENEDKTARLKTASIGSDIKGKEEDEYKLKTVPCNPVESIDSSRSANKSLKDVHSGPSPGSPKSTARLTTADPPPLSLVKTQPYIISAKQGGGKLYKKSLENHYFEYNSHPMKSVVSERSMRTLKQMTLSSARILQEQTSRKHWISDFRDQDGNIVTHIKEMRRVKTPLENLLPRNALNKLPSKNTLRLQC